MALAKDSLAGHWVHSHEEDNEDELVFRPAVHRLPPSRGRASFELRSDGSYRESSPGPVDAPEESSGRWTVEGGRLVLRGADGRRRHDWEIAAVEDDRLKLKRPEGR